VADRSRAQVFGEVAALYDRARPGYPAEAFDSVLDGVLGGGPDGAGGGRALECGAGTGKATTALAARGLTVLALEPDARMAELCRANSRAFGDAVDVQVTTLEAAALPEAAFDVTLAAQSWHWVDPEVGAGKVAHALRPGGVLALMWNWPGPSDDAALPGIEAAYRRWAPELVGKNILTSVQVLEPEHFAPLLTHDRFVELAPHETSWVQHYTSTRYADLTRTHSPHRMLAPEQRDALAAALVDAIDAVGGMTAYAYVTTVRRFRRR
jgi:SAM-dependent methyltransferase